MSINTVGYKVANNKISKLFRSVEETDKSEISHISKLFRSAEETDKSEISKINGRIPSYVNGTFIRTGPSKWDMGKNFTCNHFLDGFAMLTKFTIDGKSQSVTLDKKFLQSDSYKRGMAAGKPVITEFGTPAHCDPNKSFFSKIFSAVLPLELSDNNNGSLFTIGKEIFTTSETCYFRKIDLDTLNSPEKFDSSKLFGLNIDSPHPITDDDGGIWNMGSTFLTGLKYHLIRIPSSKNLTAKEVMKKAKTIATIPSRWNGMMSYNRQAFMITRNYVVFIEQPFVMNIAKAARLILKGSTTLSEYVEWRPEYTNRFYLIHKETGNVLKTEFLSKDPFFYLHFINTYEDDGQIIVDVNAYKNPDIFENLYLEKLRSGQIDVNVKARGTRFVLPIISSVENVPENIELVRPKSTASAIRLGNYIQLVPEVLGYSGGGLEYPIINKKYLGKKYNYYYGTGTYAQNTFSNSIAKINIGKKPNHILCWRGTPTQFPGEPQFIMNPNSLGPYSEDDGVLCSAVTDKLSKSNDFILFLDAKTMKEIGRAKFQNHLPLASHGIFLRQ